MANIIYPRNNPHLKNQDGSWDSICSTCFTTIATASKELDLAAADRHHICNRAEPKKLGLDTESTLDEIKRLLEAADPGITVTEFIPSPHFKKSNSN